MTFIDKDNNIVTCNMCIDYNELEEEKLYNVDSLIAPAIREFNRHGYKTKFSCSGHPYGDRVPEIAMVSGTYTFEDFKHDLHDTMVPLTDIKREKVDDHTEIAYVVGIAKGENAYVMFDTDIEFNSADLRRLPAGWIIEKLGHQTILRYAYCFRSPDPKIDGDMMNMYFEAYEIIMKTMKDLYLWAKSLTDRISINA